MRKSLRAAVVAAALAAVPAMMAAASPAHAADERCKITVHTLEAVNIQEDSAGYDDIWLRVGGHWWPSYLDSIRFYPGQKRNVGVTVAFNDSIEVELVEDDAWPAANDSIDTDTVYEGACATTPRPVTLDLADSSRDTVYEAKATVGPN